MPVFKTYFYVTKNRLPTLLIYLGVFVFMTILFTNMFSGTSISEFTSIKTNIIIKSQESAPLVNGLTTYLKQHTTIVTVDDDADSIKDALFYAKADYALRIPAGFTQSFMSGSGTVMLEKTSGAMSSSSVNVDFLINRYLNLAQLYVKNSPNVQQETLVTNVMNDLAKTVSVGVAASGNQVKADNIDATFRFSAYAVLAIMLMGAVSIMMAFNEPELVKRNSCAPLRPSKMNLQMFAGHAIFMVIIWLVLCVTALILGKQTEINVGILLLCLNTLVFSICSLGIAFLVGKFIRSDLALAAVANILTLGMSFLCGIFVPQELLGDSVLKIAGFLPGYWYVKAIDGIRNLTVINFDVLKPIFGDMLIQLAFALACIIIALVVTKQKKQSTDNYVL